MSSNVHDTSSLDDCRVITLQRHHHQNGNLTVMQGEEDVPYPIKRVYYLYDVPAGESRGGHSHNYCSTFLVALSGSFDITIEDGVKKRTITLNRPDRGLYLPAGIWRVLHNFSAGSICFVAASILFREDDYVRDYSEFLRITAHKRETQS